MRLFMSSPFVLIGLLLILIGITLIVISRIGDKREDDGIDELFNAKNYDCGARPECQHACYMRRNGLESHCPERT